MIQQTRFHLFRLQWRTWWKWHKILLDFLLRWFLYNWMSSSKLRTSNLWKTKNNRIPCMCDVLSVAPRGVVVVVYLPWRPVVVRLWCTHRGAPWWWDCGVLTVAPRGGALSRLHRFSSPQTLWEKSVVWTPNSCAEPMSNEMESEPTPLESEHTWRNISNVDLVTTRSVTSKWL